MAAGRTALLIGVLLGAAGTQQAPSAPVLVPDSLPDNALAWSAERRLTWQDFRGEVPWRAVGAESMLGYHYVLECVGDTLESRFVAIFKASDSWVNRDVIDSGHFGRVGLRHEQVHFDLKEVYTRRLRKYFAERANPCPRTEAQLDALARRIFEQEAAEQRRFDAQSRNGQDERFIGEWERFVAQDLKTLAAFAAPEPKR